MFAEMSKNMQERMKALEEMDLLDRNNGTERLKRLRQIPPETGKFLALTAAAAPQGEFIEVGTSAGYSTMWLSLAASQKGCIIKTHELMAEKIRLAKETFRLAEIEHLVDLKEGDALSFLPGYKDIGFCFIDCEKDMYLDVWDIVSEKMLPGGIILADNAINHAEALSQMLKKAESDPRFDTMIVTQGKGELLCRRKQDKKPY